tara:strand:- start:1267 stop:1542 length:276 start_codon:yes stop_codon:yes gene_type:complete
MGLEQATNTNNVRGKLQLNQRYLRLNVDCACMICPGCKAHEIEDCQNTDPDHLMGPVWQIKAYKVGDNYDRSWSHCVVCDCWFTDCGEIEK